MRATQESNGHCNNPLFFDGKGFTLLEFGLFSLKGVLTQNRNTNANPATPKLLATKSLIWYQEIFLTSALKMQQLMTM